LVSRKSTRTNSTASKKALKGSSEEPNSQIRKHYYLDRYVIIAPKRNLRPHAFATTNASHKLETTTSPAIENETSIDEILDDKGQWQVKAIANIFPALTQTNPEAYGKQEVIIDTPLHNTELSELPIEHIERIFDMYIRRSKALYKLPGIKHVLVFRNDGPHAGASIAHAHSQIIALPLIPPDILNEAQVINSYMEDYHSCPICDVIRWELDQKVRVVFEDKHAVVIAPYADRFPFGVWIIPRVHVNTFDKLTPSVRHSIAVVLKKITAKLDSVNISFNFFLKDSLVGHDHHFLIKVEPRTNIWAGFELGTGIIINQVAPEYTALWYQDKISN
jgi:UDPglucose--hexose-1-phosphate uridylyltransferase